jgi:hypothetical protein
MKSKNVAVLVRLFELRFEQDKQSLGKLVQRRSELQDTYTRLEESRAQTPRDSAEPIIQQRASIWGQWIDKTQAGVNMELFTVKAKEEMALVCVRGSFGKYVAIQALKGKLKNRIRRF